MSKNRKRHKEARWNKWVKAHGPKCAYCSKVISRTVQPESHPDRATIDHIVPRARGGTNAWANVVFACYQCNQDKGCGDRETPLKASLGSLIDLSNFLWGRGWPESRRK